MILRGRATNDSNQYYSNNHCLNRTFSIGLVLVAQVLLVVFLNPTCCCVLATPLRVLSSQSLFLRSSDFSSNTIRSIRKSDKLYDTFKNRNTPSFIKNRNYHHRLLHLLSLLRGGDDSDGSGEGSTLIEDNYNTSNQKKKIGTQMTGIGSRSKKNKSIFVVNNSNNDNKKGKMYIKITTNGELLFYFPNTTCAKSIRSFSNHHHHHQNLNDELEQDKKDEDGTIISLSAKNNENDYTVMHDRHNNNYDLMSHSLSSSIIHAELWKQQDDNIIIKEKKKNENKKSKKKVKKRNKFHDVDHYVTHNDYTDYLLSKLTLLPSISSSSSRTNRKISSTTHHSTSISTKIKRKLYNQILFNKWIPIEGLYGIYDLPSGPYLVLITDSELVYQSPLLNALSTSSTRSLNTKTNNNNNHHYQNNLTSLLNIRKIKSMEIIPIPFQKSSPSSSSSMQQFGSSKEEQNQFYLLRQSFKEHDFYYSSLPKSNNYSCYKTCSNVDNNSEVDDDEVVIRDITHTLQRFFIHHSLCKQKRNSNKLLKNNHRFLIMNEKSLLFYDYDKEKIIHKMTTLINITFVNDCYDLVLDGCCKEKSQHDCKIVCSQISLLGEKFLSNVPLLADNEKNKEMSMNNGRKIKTQTGWWTSLLQGDIHDDDASNESKLKPDSRFFWNEDCIQPFLHQIRKSRDKHDDELSSFPYQLLLEHTIPVTSAFVGIQKNIPITSKSNTSSQLSSLRYDQLLISRRSKYRAGTRFTKRGADGNGDVANFAETEQICFVWNEGEKSDELTEDKKSLEGICKPRTNVLEIYSHVQTRGSIPLRWSSPTDIKTYRPKVLIGTDPIAQARALRSHLIEQLSLYTSQQPTQNDMFIKLAFVNLIDKHSDQGRLGRMFSAVLDAVLNIYESKDFKINQKSLSHDIVSHVWFDFHAECKKGRWYKLRKLLDELAPTLDNQGYFCSTMKYLNNSLDYTIDKMQEGVVRTNCMDCLDRTNVVQSMFGRYMLYNQFNERNESQMIRIRRLPLEYIIGFKKDSLVLPWKSGETSHRLLWADNADAISRLYAGTPALKGDYTRTGKRTKRGALDDGLNSVTRFYLNNFLDADRQKGMDLLTGFTKFDINNAEGNVGSAKQLWRQKMSVMESNISHDETLNLGWLPGDLEGHLRSAALTPRCSDPALENTFYSDSFSSAQALIDIGRRASLDKPWWTEEDYTKLKDLTKASRLGTTYMPHIGSGHIVGLLLVLNQAPVITVMAILCFLSLGILKN